MPCMLECDIRVGWPTTVIGGAIAMLCMTLAQASATITIEGKSNAMSLTVDEAPINEVLAVLSAKFAIAYVPTPGLPRTVGGSYSGTLQQVLERILDGCDYVVSYSADKIELKILESSGSTAHASGLPPQSNLTPASGVENTPPKVPMSTGARR